MLPCVVQEPSLWKRQAYSDIDLWGHGCSLESSPHVGLGPDGLMNLSARCALLDRQLERSTSRLYQVIHLLTVGVDHMFSLHRP